MWPCVLSLTRSPGLTNWQQTWYVVSKLVSGCCSPLLRWWLAVPYAALTSRYCGRVRWQAASIQQPFNDAMRALEEARERLEHCEDLYSEVGVKDHSVSQFIEEAARTVVAAEHIQTVRDNFESLQCVKSGTLRVVVVLFLRSRVDCLLRVLLVSCCVAVAASATAQQWRVRLRRTTWLQHDAGCVC